MRAPVDTIAAPPFPPDLEWLNVAPLRMDKQIGRPVLVEFWDFCRPNSLRTLPYLKAWHERYAGDGLRVISVHTPGFAVSRDEAAVRDAVARLGIRHPVCIDSDGLVWSLYDNEGWPARYLFNQSGRLHEFHFGEGAYAETEVAIQELLGVEREPLRALRPEDEPSARIVVPSPDVAGPYRGPYVAGTVWAILAGRGEVRANGRTIAVEHPGAYELVSHPLSTEGVLDLAVGPGVECLGVCFSPGLAPPGA
jgi:thiol-disulfide isomerase/thioredoxin